LYQSENLEETLANCGLLVKHEKACNNESTVKYDTTSRCTALEDTHVNKHVCFWKSTPQLIILDNASTFVAA
jgi:hypothetical protein